MSSEPSPPSPRDNGICVPTICLDSFNDSASQLNYYRSSSDFECHSGDEQSFSSHISHFSSWLSGFTSYKKFVLAIALLSQCEPRLKQAACMLLEQPKSSENNDLGTGCFASYDSDYIQTPLRWDPTELPQFMEELSKTLQTLPTSSGTGGPQHRVSHRLSVPTTVEKSNETELTSHLLAPKGGLVGSASQHHLDLHTDKTASCKQNCLRLLTELLTHLDDYMDDLFLKSYGEWNGSPPTAIIRELVVQSSVGQLVVKTTLHPAFTSDERSWFLEVLRSHRGHLSAELSTLKDDGCGHNTSREFEALRLFDCFLDLAVDCTSVMQSLCPGMDRYASCLSHSLTSSGFLSGCGGSESQYDLLSEANNLNGNSNFGSHYGQLLTVPSTDSRIAIGHSNSGYSTNASSTVNLDQRRPSDGHYTTGIIPNLYRAGSSGSSSGNKMSGNGNHHASNSRMHADGSLVDGGAEGLGCHHSTKASLGQARASLPNALTHHYPVGPISEQAGDCLSFSSGSSTFSSSLELGAPSSHQPSPSPIVSTDGGCGDGGASDMREEENLSQSPTLLRNTRQTLTNLQTVDCLPTRPASPSMRVDCHSRDSGHSARACSNQLIYLHPADDTWVDYFASTRSNQTNEQGNSTSTTDEQGNSTCKDPNSGMTAVPMWLKSLRLHKYASLFEQMSYNEFVNVQEAWLEERNVTQGARNKLLLSIRKLSSRASSLTRVESILLQTPTTGPAASLALRNCLSEVWNVLHTPMKPCTAMNTNNNNPNDPTPVHSTYGGSPDRLGHSLPVTDKGRGCQGCSNLTTSSNSIRQTMSKTTQIGSDAHVDSIASESDICLPGQIMSCLTKVCSRILVSSKPDSDCCLRFVELLELINKHPAFPDKHRSLTTSWKLQLFSIPNALPFQLCMDPSRLSRSVPRAYHSSKLNRHGPHHHGSRSHLPQATRKLAVPEVDPTPLFGGLELGTGDDWCAVQCNRSDLIQPMDNHSSSGFPGPSRGNHCPNLQPLDHHGLRRHSVPMHPNYTSDTGMGAIKCFTGRRMPSPNPDLMPHQQQTQTINPSVPPPPPPQHSTPAVRFPSTGPTPASSELHVSRLAAQLHRTRFPSPSSYEAPPPCPSSIFRSRGLAPPATAPPTRMPSPSDVQRCYHPLDCTASSTLIPFTDWTHAPPTCTHCTDGGMSGGQYAEAVMSNRMQMPTSCRASNPNFTLGSAVEYPNQMFPQKELSVYVAQESARLNQQIPRITGSSPMGSSVASLHPSGSSLLSTRHDSRRPTQLTASSSQLFPGVTDVSPDHAYANAMDNLACSSCQCFKFGFHPLDSQTAFPSANSVSSLPTTPRWPILPTLTATGADAIELTKAPLNHHQHHPPPPSPRPSAGTDAANLEFIEHNLELLTRNVTELAIGDFDSPVEN